MRHGARVTTAGSLRPQEAAPEVVALTRKRLEGHGHLGAEYAHVYVPCVPAPDPLVEERAVAAADPLPAVLQRPLLKVAEGHSKEQIPAIRSGGRAAILLLDAESGAPVDPSAVAGQVQAVRLKGCGNYVAGEYGGRSLRFPHPGMPVAPMQKLNLMTFEADEQAVEVRGVAFPHTAEREAMMSAAVDASLRPLRLTAAIRPLAVQSFASGFDPSEPFPLLPKSVAVSTTLGERRVASHLLPGLLAAARLLLPGVAATGSYGDSAESAAAAAAALLPPSRRGEFVHKQWSDDGSFEETRHAVVPSFVAAGEPGAKYGGPADAAASEWLGTEEAAEHASGTPGVALAAVALTLPGWRRAAFERAAGRWLAARGPAGAALAAREGAPRSVVAHLYWRVGREAGAIREAMTRAGVSWGNYLDHGVEPHNNSHPNNLVVLPPSALPEPAAAAASAADASAASAASAGAAGRSWGALLAPLDLDMASLQVEAFDNASGERLSAEAFAETLEREGHELLSNLLGSTASTGLEGIDSGAGAPAAAQALHWALRDTLWAGFKAGRAAVAGSGPDDPHLTCPAVDRACRALCELALVLMADQVS